VIDTTRSALRVDIGQLRWRCDDHRPYASNAVPAHEDVAQESDRRMPGAGTEPGRDPAESEVPKRGGDVRAGSYGPLRDRSDRDGRVRGVVEEQRLGTQGPAAGNDAFEAIENDVPAPIPDHEDADVRLAHG